MSQLSDLKRRIKEARQFKIKWDDFELLVERPTAERYYTMLPAEQTRDEQMRSIQRFYECIYDWSGINESHLLDGGNGSAVPFDAELLDELFDRFPGLSGEYVKQLSDRVLEHAETEQHEKKVSLNG